MGESKRYFAHIKTDFVNNKAKFAVLLLSLILFAIGEINPVGEHIGTPLLEAILAAVMLLGIYSALTCFNVLRLVKAYPFPVLIIFVALFAMLCEYEAGKTPNNEMMLTATIVYGILPYLARKRKILGMVSGAIVTVVCIGMLAVNDLWYLVVAYTYISLATQILVGCIGLYGENRILSVSGIALLTILLIIATLYIVCGTIPRIEGSIESFSNTEIIALILLLAFLVFAVISVSRYDDEYRNYFAVVGLIVFVTQIVLFIFSRTNPLLSGYLGLPFAESDFANRVFAMPALVGTILAAPDWSIRYRI